MFDETLEEAGDARRPRWMVFTLFARVLLPTVSIIIEATTHRCAETFFDPNRVDARL